LLMLIPGVYLYAPFPLYQTAVQNPVFLSELEVQNPAPLGAHIAVTCSGTTFALQSIIPDNEITVHSSDAIYMPIGESLARTYRCTNTDIRVIQRHLIAGSIFKAPGFHFYKYTQRLLRNLFIRPDAMHFQWMLDAKLHLIVENQSDIMFYSINELNDFRDRNILPLRQPNLRLLASLVSFNPIAVKLFSGLVILGALSLLLLKRRLGIYSKNMGILLSLIFS
jgi:hypothetical protein